MSLFLFLIVVLSLACGSVQPSEVPVAPCLAASAGLILAWGLIAKSAAGFALARVREGINPLVVAQSLERQLEALRWMGIAAVLICLLGFNVAGAVQTWPLFSGSMLLQAMVLLTPAMLLIASTLWAEHQYGAALGYTPEGILPAVEQTAASLLRFTGWILAPILVMLAISDLLTLMPWSDQLPTGLSLGVLTILTVPVLVPWIAKRVWSTQRLCGHQHRWIEDLVAAAAMPRLDVRLWKTSMRSSNAVVVGFFPGLRSLLLTDRLLRDLPPGQLKLIVLHEIAHIRRHHIWLRMLAVVPGWFLAAGILHVYGTSAALLLVSNASAIASTLVMLRLSAHETEFDADRAACELAMQIPSPSRHLGEGGEVQLVDSPPDAHAAAAALAAALRRVSGDSAAAQDASWLHPSIDSRCERLQLWADAMMQKAAPADAASGGSAPCSLPTI